MTFHLSTSTCLQVDTVPYTFPLLHIFEFNNDDPKLLEYGIVSNTVNMVKYLERHDILNHFGVKWSCETPIMNWLARQKYTH